MADLIGQQLGQYEIVALIGKGGMASVYRARQVSIGRDVAVKVIAARLFGNPDFVKRFQREAQIIANLSHAHIIKVFDYGQQKEDIYLVMELLLGGSLFDIIQRQGSLSPERVTIILDQIASALDHAHQKGVIHRDLKPHNVLFDESGNAYLTDFGVAKLINETTTLTQSGIMMGTPAYMSPEQWIGQTLDSRTDIYALGVMIFEMLTGRQPFQADTPHSMMHKHIYESAPAITILQPNIPKAVEGVLSKTLSKEQDNRYQTAGDLAKAFKLALQAVDETAFETKELAPRPLSESKPPVRARSRTVSNRVHERVTLVPVDTPKHHRTGILIGGVVLLIALLGIGALALSGAFQANLATTASTTPTTSVAVIASATSTKLPVVTQVAFQPTILKTVTSNPITSPTAIGAGILLTPTIRPLPSSTLPSTFTPKPTNTPSPTGTPSTVPTRTPDLPGTATQQKILELFATAYAVASYTKTFTPSPTFTPLPPSSTPTITLTFTYTPTHTPLPPTPTSSKTLTSTPIATLTPTKTLVPATPTPAGPAPIQLDNLNTLREVAQIKRTASSIAWTEWGNLLAVDADNQDLLLYDMSSPNLGTQTPRVLSKGVNLGLTLFSMSFSPDGSLLAGASSDGTVRLWQVSSGKQLTPLHPYTSVVNAVTFSPNGSLLVYGGLDGKLWIWDLDANKSRKIIPDNAAITSIAFSPQGGQIAYAIADGSVRLLDLDTYNVRTFPQGSNSKINNIAFSPDGEKVAAASLDTTIRLWNVKTLANPLFLKTDPGQASNVLGVAFNRDSTLLASAHNDYNVRLWNVASGDLITVLKGHFQRVNQVLFSPDGSQLVSSASDATIRIWMPN